MVCILTTAKLFVLYSVTMCYIRTLTVSEQDKIKYMDATLANNRNERVASCRRAYNTIYYIMRSRALASAIRSLMSMLSHTSGMLPSDRF